MARHGDLLHIRQRFGVSIHLLGILDLIGDRHLLEVTLTLTVPIEVEADRGDPLRLQAGCHLLLQGTLFLAHEAVHQHHHRHLLARL